MSYSTYTPSGPWTNNAPPGISAAALTAIESFLAALWGDSQITSNGSGIETVVGLITGSGLLSLAAHPQSISGSTSGTLTINEYMTGTGFKAILCYFNNYRNSGAAQSVTLNTAFTVGAACFNLGGNGLNLLAGATSQQIVALTTLGGTSSGSTTNVTNLLPWSIGSCMAAITGIKEPGSNGSAATGLFVIIGY